MRARRLLAAISVLALPTAVALAAGRASIRDGGYAPAGGPPIPTGRHILVTLTVTSRGTLAKYVRMTCRSHANPTSGANTPIDVTVPAPPTLRINRHGAFRFTGNVQLTTADTHSTATATSTLTITGQFKTRKARVGTTTTLRGTATASICQTGTLNSYTDAWN
jgi:hypothetical protein